MLTGDVGKVSVASYEGFFPLSPETAVVWRAGQPPGRPPEESALSGPPHVRDLHDGEPSTVPLAETTHTSTGGLPKDEASESDVCLCLQPDLLNFKKGWMVKLEGSDQVNHCFVLVLYVNSCDCLCFCQRFSFFSPPLVEEVLVCALY